MNKEMLLRERRFIGFSLIVVGFITLIIGLWGNKFDGWHNSFSMAYWTNARVVFILLFGFAGLSLALYEGYDVVDRIIDIITGASVILLIMFPTYSSTITEIEHCNDYNVFPNIKETTSHLLHTIFCFSVMGLSFINIRFLFTKGNSNTEKKKLRNKVYKITAYSELAVFVLQSIIVIIFNTLHPANFPIWLCEIFEILDIGLIGFAWLVKGEMFKKLND